VKLDCTITIRPAERTAKLPDPPWRHFCYWVEHCTTLRNGVTICQDMLLCGPPD